MFDLPLLNFGCRKNVGMLEINVLEIFKVNQGDLLTSNYLLDKDVALGISTHTEKKTQTRLNSL